MKMSHRARRMERHHKRKKNSVGFNMISLMDIFTILVFFLLVNSSDVEVLQTNKAIKLPESTAEKKPKETLVLVVNSEDIVIKGQKVAKVADIINADDEVITSLKNELDFHAQRAKVQNPGEKFAGEITIMGDKAIPYLLLKKIMMTCARSEYSKISLAVMQKAQEKS
jgi:biopolymer transport protein ExbD